MEIKKESKVNILSSLSILDKRDKIIFYKILSKFSFTNDHILYLKITENFIYFIVKANIDDFEENFFVKLDKKNFFFENNNYFKNDLLFRIRNSNLLVKKLKFLSLGENFEKLDFQIKKKNEKYIFKIKVYSSEDCFLKFSHEIEKLKNEKKRKKKIGKYSFPSSQKNFSENLSQNLFNLEENLIINKILNIRISSIKLINNLETNFYYILKFFENELSISNGNKDILRIFLNDNNNYNFEKLKKLFSLTKNKKLEITLNSIFLKSFTILLDILKITELDIFFLENKKNEFFLNFSTDLKKQIYFEIKIKNNFLEQLKEEEIISENNNINKDYKNHTQNNIIDKEDLKSQYSYLEIQRKGNSRIFPQDNNSYSSDSGSSSDFN